MENQVLLPAIEIVWVASKLIREFLITNTFKTITWHHQAIKISMLQNWPNFRHLKVRKFRKTKRIRRWSMIWSILTVGSQRIKLIVKNLWPNITIPNSTHLEKENQKRVRRMMVWNWITIMMERRLMVELLVVLLRRINSRS